MTDNKCKGCVPAHTEECRVCNKMSKLPEKLPHPHNLLVGKIPLGCAICANEKLQQALAQIKGLKEERSNLLDTTVDTKVFSKHIANKDDQIAELEGRLAEEAILRLNAEDRAEVAVGAYNTCYERNKEPGQQIADLEQRLAENWLDAPTQAGMYWMSPFCDGDYRYPHMKEVLDFDRPGRGLEVVDSPSDCVPIDLYLREYYPKSKWLFIACPKYKEAK